MKSVENFNSVRDIPYSIPLDSTAEDCCCNGKVRRLRQLLEQDGLVVRYRVCSFRWSDLGVPKNILEMQKDDLATHVYLEVKIDGVWIKVDPTWDSRLKNIFPIAKWDGKTSTILAVDPIDVYSVDESEEIMGRCTPKTSDNNRRYQANDFDVAFNKWLEENRV